MILSFLLVLNRHLFYCFIKIYNSLQRLNDFLPFMQVFFFLVTSVLFAFKLVIPGRTSKVAHLLRIPSQAGRISSSFLIDTATGIIKDLLVAVLSLSLGKELSVFESVRL